MTGMPRPPALSPLVVGDPVTAEPEVRSLPERLRRLGLGWVERPGLLELRAGVVLVRSLTGSSPGLALRWVRLPHGPTLAPDGDPLTTAVILTAPLSQSGRALRVAGRLMACFRDVAFSEHARSATSREGVVRLLAEVEERAGESALTAPTFLDLLGSAPTGLGAAEGERRQRLCGPNRLERAERRSLLTRLGEQFTSFFALLLWVGGALAFLAGLPELGWAIFAVILVNGVFSFLQEYRAERALEALQELLPREITALRGGAEDLVPASALVPGDVVRLDEGDQVPADGQLLEAAGLRVDQSALTGESHPVFKLPSAGNERERVPFPERHELVFAGTGVVAGSAMLVLRAIGMSTEIGAIARLAPAVGETPSPLQREMARVTRIVTLLAVVFGAAFFALGLAARAVPFAEGLVFALGVIVANVPEGLLPALTLALGVQRMARQRSVVKRLSAVEALGATSAICTDKTGTLTQNRLTARFVWSSGRVWSAGDLGGEPAADVRELLEVAVLASQATADHGDPTEVALVVAAASAGVDPEKLRLTRPLRAPHPFDSFRKRMTLVRATEGGAADRVIRLAPCPVLSVRSLGEGGGS